MLILSIILHLYVIQKYYKCDCPNCPPIHPFTQLHIGSIVNKNETILFK